MSRFHLLYSKPDWVGVASASLCVVHCLLTPFLVTLAATYEWWPGLSYLFLFLSFYAALETSQHSGSSPWLWLIWPSVVALAISILLEEEYHGMELLSYLASAGLVVGHLLNIRHCKKCL